MTMRPAMFLLLGGVLCVCGCRQGPQKVGAVPPQAVADVDDVLVRILPAALNWDESPGPDGLQVSVLFFRRGGALPVTVSGTLEFLLYEGNVARRAVAVADPFYTWRFSAREMKGYLVRGTVGWGYAMRLAWGGKAPAAGTITLVARYSPPEGRALYSAPVAVALEPK